MTMRTGRHCKHRNKWGRYMQVLPHHYWLYQASPQDVHHVMWDDILEEEDDAAGALLVAAHAATAARSCNAIEGYFRTFVQWMCLRLLAKENFPNFIQTIGAKNAEIDRCRIATDLAYNEHLIRAAAGCVERAQGIMKRR